MALLKGLLRRQTRLSYIVSFQVENGALPPHTEELYGTAHADSKRINFITRWTSVVKRETARVLKGGKAIFHFTGKELRKIIVRDYGEMHQHLPNITCGRGSFLL